MRRLSADEHVQYHRDGFVVVPDLVPGGECAAIDSEIERLSSDRAVLDPERPTFILQLGLRSEITRRICVDERFITLVADIVQPGVAIYSAKMVSKIPGRAEACHWHQDDHYYRANSIARVRMSIWLALHDSDASNGGVRFVPGSHRWGIQEHEHRAEGVCNHALRSADPVRLGAAVCPAVRAGSVVLFDALTWHGSEANRSGRLRRAFIVSYQDALTRGGNGAQWQIVRPAPEVVPA